MLMKRLRETKERLEDVAKKVGVGAYYRVVPYEIFQTVKSYLLKLYMGDEVNPPADELPFSVEDAYSYVRPGFLTLPMIVGFDPLDNYTSSEQSFLAIVRHRNKRYYISFSFIQERYGDLYVIFVVGEDQEE